MAEIKLTSLLDSIINEKKVYSSFSSRYKNILSPNFSLFNFFYTNELVLSKILADLLNPNGSHGQDELFLQHWIESKNLHLQDRWHNIRLDQSIVTVKLEERAWRSDTLRRMDILVEIIFQDKIFAICIENKPFALDQHNQVKDYVFELKQRYTDWQLIYLSGQGQNPHELSICKLEAEQLIQQGQFSVWSYADLLPWLTQCALYTKNERVNCFLEEFKAYISKTFITQLNHHEQTDMLKTILDNNDYIKTIMELEHLKTQVQNSLLKKLKSDLQALCSGFEVEGELTSHAYSGISIYKKNESQKVRFRIEFDRPNFGLFFLGLIVADFNNITLTTQDRESFTEKAQQIFPATQIKESPHWPVYIDLPDIAYWNVKGDIWVDIQNGTFAQKIYTEYFKELIKII